jgi:hypothetical protein
MNRGRSRDVDRALVQSERFDQHVQLFAQPRDRQFGAAQIFALGTVSRRRATHSWALMIACNGCRRSWPAMASNTPWKSLTC